MKEAVFTLIPPSAGLETLIVQAKAYALGARAESTRRALAADWQDVEAWTSRHGVPSLRVQPSPEVIALYLTDRASTLSPQTLTRRLTSITQALRAAGFDGPSPASTRHPLVGAVLRGIRRTKGVAPGPNQKSPLLTEDLRRIIAICREDLQGLRDRALILVGFAGGGVRRANLAAIDIAALEFSERGVTYHQGRSKTDQEGVGRKVAIPYGSDPATCPVRALRAWLEAAGITVGPVFRAVRRRGGRQVIDKEALNPGSLNYIVKRLARRAGMDAEAVGVHSLRSGFCTQAAMVGGAGGRASDRAVMKQSGHKCGKSLDRYVRPEFGDNNAANHLGL